MRNIQENQERAGQEKMGKDGKRKGRKKERKNQPIDKWAFLGKGSVPYNGKAYGGTNFIGPGPDVDPYTLPLNPVDEVDAAAQVHDYAYFEAKTGGAVGAFFDKRVAEADIVLTFSALRTIRGYHTGELDDVTGKPISIRTYNLAVGVVYLFSGISLKKIIDTF
ncbi:hypothetical protein [Flavobacterium sp. LAR06]|uniref:hypothetical protein n=1 Tax=Flavobacterium sp. LAR06 TaxID=3064897 RepID=UPI0035C0E1C6